MNHPNSFPGNGLSAHRMLVRIFARPSRISYVSVHRDNAKRIEIQMEREREASLESVKGGTEETESGRVSRSGGEMANEGGGDSI